MGSFVAVIRGRVKFGDGRSWAKLLEQASIVDLLTVKRHSAGGLQYQLCRIGVGFRLYPIKARSNAVGA
jgi:hypothetical protein